MGDYNSSLTRVQPIFDELLDRWPDGNPGWASCGTWRRLHAQAPPSEVMFVCENPSLAGVRLGLKQGQPPDIESQWGGGEIDNPAL